MNNYFLLTILNLWANCLIRAVLNISFRNFNYNEHIVRKHLQLWIESIVRGHHIYTRCVQYVVWSVCVSESIYTSYEIESNEHNELVVAVVRDGSVLKGISWF